MRALLLLLAFSLSSLADEKPLVTVVFNNPVSCGQAIQIVRSVPVSLNCNRDRRADYAYSVVPIGVAPVGKILGQLRRLRGVRRAELSVGEGGTKLPTLPGGY